MRLEALRPQVRAHGARSHAGRRGRGRGCGRRVRQLGALLSPLGGAAWRSGGGGAGQGRARSCSAASACAGYGMRETGCTRLQCVRRAVGGRDIHPRCSCRVVLTLAWAEPCCDATSPCRAPPLLSRDGRSCAVVGNTCTECGTHACFSILRPLCFLGRARQGRRALTTEACNNCGARPVNWPHLAKWRTLPESSSWRCAVHAPVGAWSIPMGIVHAL